MTDAATASMLAFANARRMPVHADVGATCKPRAAHATANRANVLPTNLPPRGLSRAQAAAYVGVSPTKFDQMVSDGRMPRPKRVDARLIWDRQGLDIAFSALPDNGVRDDPWMNVAV